MSQFFESICVKDGIAKNLAAHQARVNKTLEAFNASNEDNKRSENMMFEQARTKDNEIV